MAPTNERIKRKKNEGSHFAPKKFYPAHEPTVTVREDGTRIVDIKAQSATKMKWAMRRTNFEKRKNESKVSAQCLKKYTKGEGVNLRKIRSSLQKAKIKKKEEKIKEGEEETARAEILLTEIPGLLEAEEGTYTSHITQKQIRKAVDITSASKSFDLNLTSFGPYKFRYTKNGRHIVLGGRKGHLAAFDWLTKKLHFEINVTESIHDVCYLDNEQRMAVAQKRWVYTYDHLGVETHCLKMMDRVVRMEYLPYHCLLCTGSEAGFLAWLDVTIGAEVITVPTRKGSLQVMCQNPYNAVICCGHNNGTVTMWTPNSKGSVSSMLCHPQPIRAIDVDMTGKYLATAGTDKVVRIWDTRNMGTCLQSYQVPSGVNKLSFSQKGLLAASANNVVHIYKNVISGAGCEQYMRHNCERTVTGLQFCPFEDVLGVSSYNGFCSLIIPGSGYPNFDAMEANPYMSKAARREAEVKNVLQKIPHSLITLDPDTIGQVDTPTLEEKIEATKKLIFVKPPKIDVTPRYRMKGKSGSAQKFKRKQKVVEKQKKDYIRDALQQKEELGIKMVNLKQHKTYGPVLDKFLSKQKIKK